MFKIKQNNHPYQNYEYIPEYNYFLRDVSLYSFLYFYLKIR